MTYQEKSAFAVCAAIAMRRGNEAAYTAIKEACFYADFTWHEYHVTLENGRRILAGITYDDRNFTHWLNACDPDEFYMQGINCKTGESVYAYVSGMQAVVNEQNEKHKAKTA